MPSTNLVLGMEVDLTSCLAGGLTMSLLKCLQISSVAGTQGLGCFLLCYGNLQVCARALALDLGNLGYGFPLMESKWV